MSQSIPLASTEMSQSISSAGIFESICPPPVNASPREFSTSVHTETWREGGLACNCFRLCSTESQFPISSVWQSLTKVV
uniref:Uncharacterized protein n=1 Tax=Arundo donax TaxID=35708 RepID=A0A0A8YFC7_ARUDO